MNIVIKSSRISLEAVRRLEALGYRVTVIVG